jgi:myo-inositol-1-phosphate synthase
MFTMTSSQRLKSDSLLLIVAGARGAVASTLAVAVAAMRRNPDQIMPSLTTADLFAGLGPVQATGFAGWDAGSLNLTAAIKKHGVIPEDVWRPHTQFLEQLPLFRAPDPNAGFDRQVKDLVREIEQFKSLHPSSRAVFINLLPAAACPDLNGCQSLSQLANEMDIACLPDLAYTVAAIRCGIPVINFTPNRIEIPLVLNEARKMGVPMAGRDGKTGQTYFKVVLASALKARNLLVDGWYSLNILGNADGANLMDPDRAAGKLSNKTNLLDEILGYPVGANYGSPSHKVHIDYYPPRGDAKEAWDVVDFKGLFGLPMSLRLNLIGRDSILAAPLVLDLARWIAVLQLAGRRGPVPELAFYFKKAVGNSPPLTFQDQITSLARLELECHEKIADSQA